MKFFDFHADTIGECFLQNKRLLENDLHIDLRRAGCFSDYGQIFAIWIPDEKRSDEAFSYYRSVRARFFTEMRENASQVAFCQTPQDIEAAFAQGKIAALLSVEGGAVLGGQLERLDDLYRDGVRLMTLTWNGSNEIGHGCFAEDKSGLTAFGKSVVEKMQRLGMLVDVSHLNERGFYDVAAYTDRPFLASHSNAKIIDNPFATARNLTKEQIGVLIDRKGLIGVNLCMDFLGNGDDTGMDAVLRQIVYFLDLGARENLSFGCDFDGCTVHPDLAGISRIPSLFDYLLQHGISEAVLRDIFFANGKRFLVANLQKL